MKKLITVLLIAMACTMAFTVVASAAGNVYYPNAQNLYNFTYDLGTDNSGAMYGMVVVEAEDPAITVINDVNIRYIDQVVASDGKLAFADFAPMALSDGTNQYVVYIGGEGLSGATRIGTLSLTAASAPDTPVVPTAVTLNKTAETLKVGETLTLTESVTPSDAEYTAEWTSSSDGVATVVDGVVTAKASGIATITVQVADGVTATCRVTVEATTTPDDGDDDETVKGDVDGNGRLSPNDSTMILRKLAGHDVTIDEDVADTDGNGKVSPNDSTMILRKLAGHDVTLH